MKTWRGRSEFSYTGTVNAGVEIAFGNNRKIYVSAEKFGLLLEHFAGRTVELGTSRTKPQVESIGMWLQAKVTKTAIASYIGPILVREGYAQRVHDPASIRIFERRGL